MYGVPFDQHDDRYARTSEWLDVVDGMWREPVFSLAGRYYTVDQAVLEPKPVRHPRPTLYAGGESPAAKDLISKKCDAWLTHGDPPDVVGRKVADMRDRREAHGLPPMTFGVGRIRHRSTTAKSAARREVERITDVRQSAQGYANYQEWIVEHAARAARQPGGLFGLEPRSPQRPGRYARAGRGAGAGVRDRRASISCCCSSARSSRKWSASPNR